MTKKHIAAAIIAVSALAAGADLRAQQPPAQAGGGQPDHVAALKQTLQQGMALARKFEWVETTIISLKGEEKARKQSRCYYGADGKVQKISVDQPAQEQSQGGGGRGRRGGGKIKQQIVEKKKDEMTDYMEQAVALIQQYVPPKPEQIQAARDAGRVAANPQADGTVKIVINQYLQAGDSLTIGLDPKTNSLLGLGINTYLGKPEDVVTLAVQMSSLPGGAIYAAQTTLEAKAKNITVVIQNSGFKTVSQ